MGTVDQSSTTTTLAHHVVHSGQPIITSDHILLVAAVVGAIGALATAASVGYAALQLRRRPEVCITWWVNDVLWPKDKVLEVSQDHPTLKIRIGAHNVGNATGETSMTNFAVPYCCRLADARGQMGTESGDNIAGKHTDDKVFFVVAERRFYPGMMWIHDETVNTPFDSSMPIGFTHEFVFTIEDDRFSARGKRWLPSRARPLVEHREQTKVWRLIRAAPEDVVCGPGYRRSTRSIKIG